MINSKPAVLVAFIFTFCLAVQAGVPNPQHATGGMKAVFEMTDSLIQPADAKKDIDVWFDWIHATHPDLSYTINDIEKFYTHVAQIKDSINSPVTVLQFWKRFSVLNSQLSDGHLKIGDPGPDYLKEYISKGGTLFPFEVIFNDSKLVITDLLGGKVSDLKGYQIVAINKIPIDTVLYELLLRINGDTDRHRKALLQKRFAYYLMLFYGESKQFTLAVRNDKGIQTITVKAFNEMPVFYKAETFANNFKFKILEQKAAVVTINTFGWDKKEDFFKFMETVFADIKSTNINHLIIDVRENSGGDDDMWRDGILKYIANKPYRWASGYRKKVVATKTRDKGQVIGTVVTGALETLIPVETTQNKFSGNVTVLIGAYTYSSAILFANTVQDFGFAKLAGESTGGKSGQTGGIQFLTLPNTKLRMVAPRFILERPNGGNLKEVVRPDIEISYDKTRPDDLIKKLLVLI